MTENYPETRYELLGNFNDWGNTGSIEDVRFVSDIRVRLCKGDRFKIHSVCEDRWYGYDCLAPDYPAACFSPVNDNYCGKNICCEADSFYNISIESGTIHISK